MGGAVSAGHDNDELVDNLKEADYIKTWDVERVFRIVDRGHYYLLEYRKSAYKDLAWKSGTLHLSAPCIYSEVLEALELETGMSFLNLGSGTGYLNTMVGFMIGSYGINHGIELHEDNVIYAKEKFESFKQLCPKFDDLELCEPQFVTGNCLNLAPEHRLYDRVYCGASCPLDKKETIQGLLKVGGVLVVPVGDQLLKIKRESDKEFTSSSVLPVSFASLVMPVASKENIQPIMLPDVNPMSLQCISRIAIRKAIRATFDFDQPTKPIFRPSRSRGQMFEHERAINPIDIHHGLMIVGPFDNSDVDDQLEEEDTEDEEEDGDFLERQLLRHAQELRRVSQRLVGVEAGHSSDSVDMEDMSDEDIDLDEGNTDSGQVTASSSSRGSHEIPEAMESEDGVTADDEEEEDEEKDDKDSNTVVQKEASKDGGSVARKPEEGVDVNNSNDNENDERSDIETFAHTSKTSKKIEQRENVGVGNGDASTSKDSYDSLLKVYLNSEKQIESQQKEGGEDCDDAIDVASQPVAIQNASVSTQSSQPRNIKISYSTSADTSETSGFGSLGEEIPTLGSQISTDGSFKDDLSDSVMENAASDSGSLGGDVSPSTSLKEHQPENMLVAPQPGEDSTSLDHDSSDSDGDTPEGGWLVGCNDPSGRRPWMFARKRITGLEEDRESSSEEEEEEVERRPEGPDFSAFLKEKVETLPIPSSLKAFVLHYR